MGNMVISFFIGFGLTFTISTLSFVAIEYWKYRKKREDVIDEADLERLRHKGDRATKKLARHTQERHP